MIDTICAGFEKQLDDDTLSSWGKSYRGYQSGGYKFKYEREDKLFDEVPVKSTYYRKSFTKKPLLLIEFSLPHLVHGSNTCMIWNIQEAIQSADQCLSKLPWYPNIELRNGQISRLDVCWNHQVGDRVRDYINAIWNLSYGKRQTMPYKNCGVMFKSRDVSTKFYNKYLECKQTAAIGLLRQESTCRSLEIPRITQLKNACFRDVTEEMILKYLQTDLTTLGLQNAVIGTCSTAVYDLCKHFKKKGAHMLGLLFALERGVPKQELARMMNISTRTINRALADLNELKLARVITTTDTPLPPLSIPDIIEYMNKENMS